MKIHGRSIETGPCFIVAEIGLNHNGRMDTARALIDAAAKAGADAVKLQKRDAKACLTQAALDAPYTGRNSFGPTYGAHRAALELTGDQWAELREYAVGQGLMFFGSAFDVKSLEVLAKLGLPAIKIPSCDLTHTELLHAALATDLPLILSTGMATEVELDKAVDTLAPARATRHLAMLHCVSGYPVENPDANLRRMDWLKRYAVPVGYSGHEKGIAISVAAVARGATILERHLTLDRTMPGPDHAASLEPVGFTRLVRDVRKVEAALGPMIDQPMPTEMVSKRKLRKCAVAARPLVAGTVLGNFEIRYKSPEVEGAVPADRKVWGKMLTRTLEEDEPIMLADLK
jgi:sialic acid synthase SpsE